MHCLQSSKKPSATGVRTATAPMVDPSKQKQATRPVVDASLTPVDASVILPSQTLAPIPDPVRFTPRKAKDAPRRNNTTAQNEASAPRSVVEAANKSPPPVVEAPVEAANKSSRPVVEAANKSPWPVVEAANKSPGKEIAKEGVHYGIYDGKLAKEHANWVDTSEDELHDDTDFEDLLMESDDNKQDECNLDEDANVDEDDEFQDPRDPVSADQYPPVVATNGPTTASDARLNNIDDLTPTQVLFGHGSFGGIVLSQPADGGIPGVQSTTAQPLQSPGSAKGTFADHEMAVRLDSPSPQQIQKTGMDPRPGGPCTPAAQNGK
ncbi:unnamed protein product [Calypogeia fissa]